MRKKIIAFIEFFRTPLFTFIPSETFRYLFCGVTTVLVDWVTYFLSRQFVFKNILYFNPPKFASVIPGGLDKITPETLSLIPAFLFAFIWGFAINKYLVFTTATMRGRIQLFRYAIIVGSCILFNYLLMQLFLYKFNVNEYFSRMITTLIVAVYSYIVQRLFTFK